MTVSTAVFDIQHVCLREDFVLMEHRTILIKGAGEKASAVACGLYEAGFKMIVMTDLSLPRSERRTVCFSEAIIDGRQEIEGLAAERTALSGDEIFRVWADGKIPVIADPDTLALNELKPNIFIDAVMAKRNTGTTIADAPLVVALGPGFAAGRDCHFVVETNPASPSLGRVILTGEAEKNTQRPTSVMEMTFERIIRAPETGRLVSLKNIGDRVKKEEIIGHVNSISIRAPVSGCLWGLVRDGLTLKKGQKIGDVDPRGEPMLCFEITPESQRIARGVIKGIRVFERGRSVPV